MSESLLSRRTLLGHAVKAAIGLPLLHAMLPIERLYADETATTPLIPKRLCVIYVPHGIYLNNVLPTQTGTGFPLPPTLQPLAGVNGNFSVISNLWMDGPGVAHRSGEMFLTNERIAELDRVSLNRLSMDRLVVKRNEGQTLIPSLQLSLSGACSGGGLRNTVSFDHNGIALLGQHDPRAVFEQLFGNPNNPQRQREELSELRSILDGATPEVNALRKKLGGEDQRVLEEYLESVRETERYLERREKRIEKPVRPEDQGLALDHNDKVSERMRNMFDLMYLAFRADLTRVITFTVFKERADGEQQYPELGLVGEHHGWSHAFFDMPDVRDETIKTLSKVDRFHCEQLAYFLKRLHDTSEGTGTMLDNTLVLYGSALNLSHDSVNLPLVLAGGAAMGIKQGQHVHFEKPESLSNLNQTLLKVLLGDGCPKWKDSTRVLTELLV